MAGCGLALPAPEHCTKDHWSLPTDEEIRPWVEGLKTILNTDYSAQFAQAKVLLSPERATNRVIAAFAPLCHKSASNHPQFYRN